MKMSKGRFARKLTTIVCAGTLVGGLASCSSGQAENDKSLTVAVSSSPSATGLRAVAKDFTSSTGITVKFVKLPYDQIAAKTLLAAKKATASYDVVQFDSPMLASLVSAGALEDLDSRISKSSAYDNSDLPKQVQDYAKIDGKSYGVPLSTEPYVLWYRKDLYQKAGVSEPPETWQEYKAISDKMKALGAFGSDSGYGSDIGAYYWLETIYNYGGKLYDTTSCKAELTSPEATAATKMYLSLVPATPGTAVNGGGNEMTTAFVQQDVAQMVNATGYYSIISDPKQSKVSDKFAMALPPSGDGAHQTLLFGWLAGVMAKSAHKDQAWKFLEYALGKKGMHKMIAAGAPPTARTSLVDDKAIVSKLPYLPTLVDAAKIGTHLPYTSAMPKIISSLSVILNGMAVNGTSIADGLKKAESSVNDILSSANACK